MKKLILAAVVVMSAVTFGRDYEYREKPLETNMKNPEMMSRMTDEEYSIVRSENFRKYSEFHRELKDMERGGEER